MNTALKGTAVAVFVISIFISGYYYKNIILALSVFVFGAALGVLLLALGRIIALLEKQKP
jgi:small basic protein